MNSKEAKAKTVVVFGATGAGKSTTLNGLMIGEQCLKKTVIEGEGEVERSVIDVDPKNEVIKKGKYFKIGHDKSETRNPDFLY